MKKQIKKFKKWLNALLTGDLFEKAVVFVFIHEEYKTVMLFSYDMAGLSLCVEKYNMRGHVEERFLSFYALRHLKKTVSELRFNEAGDIIVKNTYKKPKTKE